MIVDDYSDVDLRTLTKAELTEVMARSKAEGDEFAIQSGKCYGLFQAAARCLNQFNPKPVLDPGNVTAAHGAAFVYEVHRGYGTGSKDRPGEV